MVTPYMDYAVFINRFKLPVNTKNRIVVFSLYHFGAIGYICWTSRPGRLCIGRLWY